MLKIEANKVEVSDEEIRCRLQLSEAAGQGFAIIFFDPNPIAWHPTVFEEHTATLVSIPGRRSSHQELYAWALSADMRLATTSLKSQR